MHACPDGRLDLEVGPGARVVVLGEYGAVRIHQRAVGVGVARGVDREPAARPEVDPEHVAVAGGLQRRRGRPRQGLHRRGGFRIVAMVVGGPRGDPRGHELDGQRVGSDAAAVPVVRYCDVVRTGLDLDLDREIEPGARVVVGREWLTVGVEQDAVGVRRAVRLHAQPPRAGGHAEHVTVSR